ncbi:DUF4197 family protein [Altererythrobacter soli]|uniref:DUF4197 family protein n=1 Tax=Croceibacterium soli TaxID=1739690 RepID=A0A6I4UV02_9SPHN|nr:DUF4197 domain-containing protein [Croceibacterium soli]MXP42762.1 DUF4197 family protein [Croceibacterium soli]
MVETRVLHRRRFILGSLVAATALTLPGCASYGGGFSFTEAIRRLLVMSSERAFVRMTQPGGFWDQQVAQLGMDQFLGRRGNVLGNILTSPLFKSRLEDVFADIAVDASYRAAPIVADTVRAIGFANAMDLIRGGPTAASAFLRQEMGERLIVAMLPEIGEAIRIAEDPLMGQLLSGLTGVDVSSMTRNFAAEVDNVIWGEIAREEATIRADPAATHDPVLIGVFGSAGAY